MERSSTRSINPTVPTTKSEKGTAKQRLAFERTAELEAEFYFPFVKSFEGFKNHEIANMLQLPVALVKLRIRLARKVLGYHLENYIAQDSL